MDEWTFDTPLEKSLHPASVKALLKRVLPDEPAATAGRYEIMLGYMQATEDVRLAFCRELLDDVRQATEPHGVSE